MLRRVLAADLAQRLPSADVLGDEGPIAAHPDTEIEVDVQRFDRVPGGPVMVADAIARQLSQRGFYAAGNQFP